MTDWRKWFEENSLKRVLYFQLIGQCMETGDQIWQVLMINQERVPMIVTHAFSQMTDTEKITIFHGVTVDGVVLPGEAEQYLRGLDFEVQYIT